MPTCRYFWNIAIWKYEHYKVKINILSCSEFLFKHIPIYKITYLSPSANNSLILTVMFSAAKLSFGSSEFGSDLTDCLLTMLL